MEKSPHPERSREAAQSKDEARRTADTIFAPATAPGRAGVTTSVKLPLAPSGIDRIAFSQHCLRG